MTFFANPGRRRCLRTTAVLAWLALAFSTVHAGRAVGAGDPLEELRAASGLGAAALDARQLTNGQIVSGQGTPRNDFSRGVYVESCYFVRAPLPTVGDALLRWDPSRYKESEVDVYRMYRSPVPADLFKDFRLTTARREDRWLLERTRAVNASGNPGELHLRPADVDVLRQSFASGGAITDDAARANAAWPQLLRARGEAMVNGGLAGVPTYAAGGGVTLNARSEFQSLLKMSPVIAARFAPLTDAQPMFPGGPTPDEAMFYAEQSQVRSHTSFNLGLVAARKAPGSWQVLDCTYYAADTFFLSVNLYQLWSWENGTLVWQVDYVSAPFRAYTIGLDKAFAGKEMRRDTATAVRVFRREVEGRAR